MYQQLIGLTLFISMVTVNCVVNTVPCDFNKLCSCSGTTSPIREVNCLGLTINRIPKLPDNIHIYRLNIVNSPDVEYLLNNSLGLTVVSSLVVKRCGLLTIESMAFNGTQSSLTTLDLSYNQLNNVPSLQGLTSLQWLSLKSNRLTNLNLNQWKHLFSSSLQELRNLIISDNLVTTIPDLIFNSLTSLQSLDLDNNRIATIDGKPFPSSLTSLSLANNLLEKIPSEPLWSLNKLRWLNLRGNLIANLPNYWPLTVQTIELIDLSHNLLTSLSNQFVIPLSKLKSSTYNKRVSRLYPKVVQHLADDDSDDLIQTNETAIHIRELLLDFNSIATIDELTFKWVIIDRLSLANNQLNNLPENLFENSLLSNRLRVLDVSFNPAISLMGQPLKGLTRLTNLLVKGVKLSFMGQSFFSNSSSELQMVDLSCNQLKSVPTKALSTTRKLIRLNLADNEIIKLNGDSFGKWSAKLLSLSLSKNGLQFISPDTFKNTVNLRELRLGFNNLLTTSSTYGQFLMPLRSSLTILELSYSIGSQLFSTLHSMVKLELLELDNNRLIDRDSLDNIKELTSLVHIDLEGNQLRSLPISLFNGSVHTKLRNIVVSSNKLVQIGGKTFNSLGQVVTIDLRGNQLTKLEETSFNNLPMLQTLILARNQLGSLDDRRIIVNCSNLVNLHLQENQLKFIDFSSFSDIRPTSLAAKNLSNPFGINLNVSHNQLSHIYVSEPNFDLIADFSVDGWVNGSQTLISTTTSTTTVKPGKLVTPLPVTTPTLPDSAGNNGTNETVPNEVNNNDDLSQEMNNNLPADQPIGIKRKIGLPIRSLDLSFNRLTEFNTNISKAIGVNLVTLNLNHNGLTSFPVDSFHHLTSLMSLSLSNNLISQLPDLQLNQSFTPSTSPYFTSSSSSNHSCCENLIFLDLSYNNITNIVPFGRIFSSMVNLMILDLSYNAINIIHPTIFNGTKVSKLNLKGNHLSSLTLLKPSSLPSTSSPRKHNHPSHHHHHHHHNHNHHHHQQHTHNDHQDTPEYSPGQLIMDMNWPCFGISSTLLHLDLSDNHFYSIPSEIYSCQHLIHLNLQSNHLHQFHESLVFLSTLPKLRHLDLSYNPINGDFTSNNRKQLSLSTGGNKRETITFSSLQYLHVQNCSLPTIPAIKSTHLIYLDVSHNVLYNISSSILSDIPNLLHLNLSFNELPVVPEELGLLRSLITLSLSGNPISNLDSSSFTPFKQLKTIDIRSLSLRYIDIRMFNSLKYLTDLATSTYPRVRSFRLADLLTKSLSLRSALIQVEEPILSHQIQWAFGSKLRQLIITGHQLKKILPDAFLGLHHRPDMVLRIVDTNISVLPTGLLRYLNDIRHITIDLRRNQLTQFNLDILQPIEATKSSFPFHVPFSSNGITLSGGLLLEDNPLICSCDITWLGSWLRKWLKETRKIHLLNHDTFLSTESKARLMTCKYPTKSIMNRNISIISIDLRPKANLPSIPLLDLYPQDIGCNCCSTNLSLAQLFLFQYSVYLFMVGLS